MIAYANNHNFQFAFSGRDHGLSMGKSWAMYQNVVCQSKRTREVDNLNFSQHASAVGYNGTGGKVKLHPDSNYSKLYFHSS